MPERHIEDNARRSHVDIRSDNRLAASDRDPQRSAEHRVEVPRSRSVWNDARLSIDCLKTSHTNVHAVLGADS